MNISELVIYRNLKHEDLFEDMAGLMGLGKEGQKADPFACAGELVELAVEYGFEGNLWHCFLALCLADNENAYTTTCEIRGNAGGTLDMLAKMITAFLRHYLIMIWKHWNRQLCGKKLPTIAHPDRRAVYLTDGSVTAS